MNPSPPPAGSVVVGVDGSPPSDAALDWATEEAGRRHLRLHLVHAFAQEYPLLPPPYVEMGASSDPVLGAALRRVNTADADLIMSCEFPLSFPAAVLVEASAVADTVVVGARGRGGVRGALLGSVSTQVAMHARCPVVVVRPQDRTAAGGAGEGPGRVVVGVDGSPLSATAIGYAFAQASSRGLGLTVVHAWWLEVVEGVVATSPSSPQWAEVTEQQRLLVAESLAGWTEKYPDVEVRERVIRAHPVEALVEESEHAALVVVGSRGRGGFSALLLGSVSHGVLQHAHCPVAVVRGSIQEP